MGREKNSGTELGANFEHAQSFDRRDRLRSIEIEMQKYWEESHVFERDAPSEDDGRETFLVTFPYPYMNGRLHIGHAFTVSKAEIAAAFQRMNGKNVLFPFAFHCTGMPIAGASKKLQNEIARFGNPPVFPVVEESAEDVSDVKKAKKIVAKEGRSKFQWEIMEEMGVPVDEISSFRDPNIWLQYFPPLGMDDLKMLGLHVDWRRSFITTEVNKYYDAFVRWQFLHLKEKNRIKFGKRNSIFSPADGQPCQDHDRSRGEGVGPQEYTLVKMKLLPPFPSSIAHLEGRSVFLAAATLRPETMYGQTNCWVLPSGEYGCFEMAGGDILVMSERAARNASFQDLTPQFGIYTNLGFISGRELLGCMLEAPLSLQKTVRVLPMLTVSLKKGTGVVTCVPSDSADDYATLMDLKTKSKLRADFDIPEELVATLEPISILEIPGYGPIPAQEVVERLGIRSQKDIELLARAKEELYTQGFYKGVMTVGDYAGERVQIVKEKIQRDLVLSNQGIVYSEPESEVISRSGDECVVAKVDQWYIDYGENEWTQQVERNMSNIDFFHDSVRDDFTHSVGWLREWACSRQFGLGTRLPWDEQYVVDSLSDSTIYMAYYTIAHLLQGGVLDGSVVGPSGIVPEQLTPEVLNFIFLDAPFPETDIPQDILEKMRREFQYWYPVGLRVSGKDLIPNHLTMFMFNHLSIFPEDKCPRRIFCNGHILVNGKKMSKSDGTFLTVKDTVELYGADAVRFALADAGDGLDDANFIVNTVNTGILRLTALIEYVEENIKRLNRYRSGPRDTFADRVFAEEIKKVTVSARTAYDRMRFRDALRIAFFDFVTAREQYRLMCGSDEDMHEGILFDYLRTQILVLAPICPHVCEYLWRTVMDFKGSVTEQAWPDFGEPNEMILLQGSFLSRFLSTTRQEMLKVHRKKKGKASNALPKAKHITIFVADCMNDWQTVVLDILRDAYRQEGSIPKSINARFSEEPSLKAQMKRVIFFSDLVRSSVDDLGEAAFEGSLFSERDILLENEKFVLDQLQIQSFEIALTSDPNLIDPQNLSQNALPGRPAVEIFLEE